MSHDLPRFHHISTDEVYGSLGKNGLFTEETPYAPSSPYSASKASSDMLVRSYQYTYGLDTVITNCSNNYGPKQHDEKLIYVTDHCQGIDCAFHQGKSGDTYNIGGRNEKDNNYIVHKICKILDKIHPLASNSYTQFITYVKDRPGHDRRYAINATKIETELGWKADENFESGIMKTVKWYVEKYND